MRLGMTGCKLLFLGSVAAGSPLAGTAQAARLSPASHITHEASAQNSTSQNPMQDRDASTHRGGGSKASHGGGLKSGALAKEGSMAWSGHASALNAAFVTGRFGPSSRLGKNGKARIYAGAYHGGYGVIQCVAFARSDSGIEITGNATNWWDNAAGRYARGNRPEPGSVLNFRSTGHMPLGHVSVVSEVVNSREILIDHAHWGGPSSNGGGVSRGITVIDVSPSNDWSEVRVSLGASGEFGNVYPVYGFIYNRPDNGLRMANASVAPRDVAPAVEEVAAAPVHPRAVSPRRGAVSLRHGDDNDVFDRASQ